MTSTTAPTAPTVPTGTRRRLHRAHASTTPSARTAPLRHPTAPAPWDELVTAALLGTERRTPPVAAGPGRAPPPRCWTRPRCSTVRRRAGLRPAPAGERPAPAPADPRPAAAARRAAAGWRCCSPTAAARGGSRRGTAPDLTELLPQWLAAANERGYRAPEALLPALLDAARARTDLRPAALALGGAARAVAGAAQPGLEVRAARRPAGRRPALPVRPTTPRACDSCGRRACSPSGSPC